MFWERPPTQGKGLLFLQCSTFSASEFAAIRDFCFYDRNDINYTLGPRLDPALFSITLLLLENSFVRTFIIFFYHSLWRRRPGCPREVWHGERGWLRRLILTVSSWVVWIWGMLGRRRREGQLPNLQICAWLQKASNEIKQLNPVSFQRIPLLNINMSSGLKMCARRARSCVPPLYQNSGLPLVTLMTWRGNVANVASPSFTIYSFTNFPVYFINSLHLQSDLAEPPGDFCFTPSPIKKRTRPTDRCGPTSPRCWWNCTWSCPRRVQVTRPSDSQLDLVPRRPSSAAFCRWASSGSVSVQAQQSRLISYPVPPRLCQGW